MTVQLWPYQDVGAAWLAQRTRAGLFDKPRVGKTPQVIRAMDLLGHSRGWIVVPAVAREHWRRELQRFGLQRRKVLKGNSIHDFVAWAHGHADVLLPSYDMAVQWAPYLHDRCEPMQFMHFDEAHALKNIETRRSQALLGPDADGSFGALVWASHSWWITGTPVPNDPMDILTFLRHQRVMPLATNDFRRRYFHVHERTYGSSQRAKPAMLPELQQLIGNNSICRTLAETAPDLPPMTITTYPVDGDAAHVRELLRQHPGLDALIVQALADGTSLSALEAPYIATLRRILGEAKAVPYARTLLMELNGGLDKCVVFGHHRSVLVSVRDELTKHGIRCGMLVGGVTEREREAIQDGFNHDPNFRVVLGNIRAAGVAINLSASAAIDMLECDWAPRMNHQALLRVYGQTQKRGVRGRYIVLANTFDEQVNEIVAEKTKACDDLERPETALPSMAELLA